MGFKIKNSLTGEFEKLPILTLKGEKGETGGVEEYNKVDYMGNKYETLKQANDANVEYAVKTAIGEFNYLDYDGQHITATDTIEGQAKSAILKGQTLVNLIRTMNKTILEQYQDVVGVQYIEPSTKYLLKIKNNTSETKSFYSGEITEWTNIDIDANQTITKILTTKSTLGRNTLLQNAKTHTTEHDLSVIFIKYQDGMENWNIPYFEGMQSVKLPVLTTTGKNLFDKNKLEDGQFNDFGIPAQTSQPRCRTADFIQVESGSKMTLSKSTTEWFKVFGYDNNKNFICIVLDRNSSSETFTIPSNVCFIKIKFDYLRDIAIDDNIQLEYGTQATAYEPYKSNILTTTEDVTLRGIGDVQDELDCLTGEVSSNFIEITLQGLADEQYYIDGVSTNTVKILCLNSLLTPSTNQGSSSNGVCDKLPYKFIWSEDVEGWFLSSNVEPQFVIRLNKNKLETIDINGIKKYFSENPHTFVLKKDKSIKTVDLSDNHVYSYKDVTHYDCSSAEGSLVPTLSVKVPTDVQATIAQQRETIQTLNSENERLNQIQEVLKASMLDSQVQLMNLSWDTDFEVFTLRESIAPKDFLLASRTGSNIDKFSQAKFIIENDCPDLEKLNSQIEYYFSKDVFSQEQFEELTDLISIVKGGNGCEY